MGGPLWTQKRGAPDTGKPDGGTGMVPEATGTGWAVWAEIRTCNRRSVSFSFTWGLRRTGNPRGSVVKNQPDNAGDVGSVPGLGRSPGVGNGNPPPVFLPGKSKGWKSLMGYSPQGRESDTTDCAHTSHLRTTV